MTASSSILQYMPKIQALAPSGTYLVFYFHWTPYLLSQGDKVREKFKTINYIWGPAIQEERAEAVDSSSRISQQFWYKQSLPIFTHLKKNTLIPSLPQMSSLY